MDYKEKKNCVVYIENIPSYVDMVNLINIFKYSKRFSVICLIDPFFSQEKNMNADFEIRYGLPVFSTIEDSILYSESIGNEITNLIIGIDNNYLRPTEFQINIIISAMINGLDVDSGLFDELTSMNEISIHSKKHNSLVNDIRYSLPPENIPHSQDKMNKVESVLITVIGTDKLNGNELTSFHINESLNEEGYHSQMLGSSLNSWMLGVNECIFLNSMVNEFIPNSIRSYIYRMWEVSKPHFIILEGGGGLLNPVKSSGIEFLINGHPDIIVLHHSPGHKFYSGSDEFPIHSIQRQIKAIEGVSGKSVAAVTISTENIDAAELNDLSRKIKFEIDIPVYEANEYGIKRLIKYLVNISGRINYKKVKFHRRAATADS